MDPLNQQPNNSLETKKNWFLQHKVLWSVVGVVLIAVAFLVYQSYMFMTICYNPSELTPECEKFVNQYGKSTTVTDWKTYTNAEYGFEFKYPDNLTLKESSNNSDLLAKISLNHSIKYQNYGDCDMEGGDQIYQDLQDFGLTFELVAGEVTYGYYDGDYNLENLNGKWAYKGAEGCGDTSYFFPIKTNVPTGRTLVITRASIQALSGIPTWNKEEILKVPGVISKAENQKLFDEVLSTFKFTK